jgi:hypothetical protein
MEINNIKILIDIIIPGFDDIPSGTDAGVFDFLNSYYRANWNSYLNLIRGINELSVKRYGKSFVDLSCDERIDITVDAESYLNDQFIIFRDDCFKGYFSHPKWRKGKGKTIWSKLGYQPILASIDNFKKTEQ